MFFSILIINYNNLEGLKRTYESVVHQTSCDYECIIIDKGSIDGSKEFIEDNEDKFAYWCSEPVKCIYNAMNIGVEHANGDYVIFLNSGDTLFQKDVLERISLEDHDAEIVCAQVEYINNEKLPIQIKSEFNSINYLRCFIKRETLLKNPYDKDLNSTSDWKSWQEKIVYNGAKIETSDIIIVYSDLANHFYLHDNLPSNNNLEENVLKIPKITIVTVCFNAAESLEKTILSVASQNYPNIEYIIVDGCSNDGSLDIIKRKEQYISKWISEPDKGIYDAMNKGAAMATGEWINFMNAGDLFYSNATVSNLFSKMSPDNYGVIFGDTLVIKRNIIDFFKYGRLPRHKYMPSCHQSIFCRSIFLKEMPFRLKWRICADYDFFFRLAKKKVGFKYIPHIVALFDGTEGVSSTNYYKLIREEYAIEYPWPKGQWKYLMLLWRTTWRPKLLHKIKNCIGSHNYERIKFLKGCIRQNTLL